MKPAPTDIDPLLDRWRNLLRLTGLTRAQIQTVYGCRTAAAAASRKALALPLPLLVPLVLIHLRANVTTRKPAELFHTSQSTVDRVMDHLVPVLAYPAMPPPRPRHRPQPPHHGGLSHINTHTRLRVNP
jgi:hypothetical protein